VGHKLVRVQLEGDEQERQAGHREHANGTPAFEAGHLDEAMLGGCLPP
jgi:hypothetical protein